MDYQEEQSVIEQTAAYAQQVLLADSTGHDWWHTQRVWTTAREIAEIEGADRFVVELAALLHDIADWKFHAGDETAGPRAARIWLTSLNVDQATIGQVCDILGQMSFKGAGVPTPMPTLEGQIVQDADRLDALGAIGIARTFAYGGYKGQPLFDPRVPPRPHDSFEEYRNNRGTTINHFYEKLLLLRDRMNTAAGRRLADQRHRFMEQFLAQFFAELGVPPPFAP